MQTNPSPIGIIGLGLLGSAIAERLRQSGFAVLGYDADPGKESQCLSPVEIFRECNTILLSLPTSSIVSGVLKDCENVLRPGQVVIDTTTGDPNEMIEHGRMLEAREVHYLEANVAGSSAQLRERKAVLFLAGDPVAITSCQPIFDALAERTFTLGLVGSASRFKLVHNLILGLHRAVLAEGLLFAKALGFDPAEALAILEQTPARSEVMPLKGRKMVEGDYAPQATLSQHLKDVRLILDAASRTGMKLPLSTLHRALLESAEQLGFGTRDNSAILEAIRAACVDGTSLAQ